MSNPIIIALIAALLGGAVIGVAIMDVAVLSDEFPRANTAITRGTSQQSHAAHTASTQVGACAATSDASASKHDDEASVPCGADYRVCRP